MKTSIFFVTIFVVLSSVTAQIPGLDIFPHQLPEDIVTDDSVSRSYLMTTDYLDFDLLGNFLRKTRYTGEYTEGLPGGKVRWNNVRIAYADDLNEPFPGGETQEYMENFTYVPTDEMLSQDFFSEIPEATVQVKNLFWDMLALELFAYRYWDSLELNVEFQARELNSEVDMAGIGTFENRDIRLTWIGISEINGEICAVIKYSTMNNPLMVELDNMLMQGRSHYWGEIYVSMVDKEIEYATLTEDVIADITFTGQPDNYMGYTVRTITLSRIE